MNFNKKFLKVYTILFIFFNINSSYSDNHNLYEILELIQKDLKTLERAVYSENSSSTETISNNLDQNAEDVLTRHLLKLHHQIEYDLEENSRFYLPSNSH